MVNKFFRLKKVFFVIIVILSFLSSGPLESTGKIVKKRNEIVKNYKAIKKTVFNGKYCYLGAASAIGISVVGGLSFLSKTLNPRGSLFLNFFKEFRLLKLATLGLSALYLYLEFGRSRRPMVPVEFKFDLPSGPEDKVLTTVAPEETPETEVGEKVECPICGDNVREQDIFDMGCCHTRLCKRCSLRNIGIALKDKNIDNLRCTNCKNKILKADLQRLLNERDFNKINAIEDLENNYKQARLDPGYRHCPSPNCSAYYAIPKDANNRNVTGDVECPRCHERYCIDCQIAHNENETCDQAKLRENGQTEQWKKEHTKPCPECGKPIEKNGGCDHMTCCKSGGGCGYQFYWSTLGRYPN